MGIKTGIKKVALKFLPQRLKKFIWETENQKIEYRNFINLSFSQEGEDLILYRLFDNKNEGFYVDIGAHHPFRFSNTYKFYLLGWKGINIDPLPGSMEKFKASRSRDINLEIPILNRTEKDMVYYMFNEPAFNTFNEKKAFELEEKNGHKIINKINLRPFKLEEVFDDYLPSGTNIDFLSIDVEGMDLEVLKSNDWKKYRPTYIVVENFNSSLQEDLDSELNFFLNERKYRIISKTVHSLIFLTDKNYEQRQF